MFFQRIYQKFFTRKMAGGEGQEKVKRANAVKNLKYGKMVKIERKLLRMIMEDPGPRPPAPPPSSRGAPYRASETQEPTGARASSNESFQHQGPHGAREREAGAAERKSFQRESLAAGASGGEIMDTKGAKDAKDDKEAIMGRSRKGRKQLQGRQELPGARASRSRSLQKQEPP